MAVDLGTSRQITTVLWRGRGELEYLRKQADQDDTWDLKMKIAGFQGLAD